MEDPDTLCTIAIDARVIVSPCLIGIVWDMSSCDGLWLCFPMDHIAGFEVVHSMMDQVRF